MIIYYLVFLASETLYPPPQEFFFQVMFRCLQYLRRGEEIPGWHVCRLLLVPHRCPSLPVHCSPATVCVCVCVCICVCVCVCVIAAWSNRKLWLLSVVLTHWLGLITAHPRNSVVGLCLIQPLPQSIALWSPCSGKPSRFSPTSGFLLYTKETRAPQIPQWGNKSRFPFSLPYQVITPFLSLLVLFLSSPPPHTHTRALWDLAITHLATPFSCHPLLLP